MKLKNSIIEGLNTLLFPSNCFICGKTGATLCELCKTYWSLKPRVHQIEGMRVLSALTYNPATAKIVLPAKEDRNRAAQRLLAQSLVSSLNYWKAEINFEKVVFVPIPSTKPAIRRRGESFLHSILRFVAQEFEENQKMCFVWKEILIHQKQVKDQAELNPIQRMKNMESAFAMRERRDLASNVVIGEKEIILIDDVVTTGATLLSANKALRERNLTVLGAVTACASSQVLPIR